MTREYCQGDLVRIVSRAAFTLGIAPQTSPLTAREYPRSQERLPSSLRGKNKWECIEGKLALIVYVLRNRLNQVIGYHILCEGLKMFCKANVAHKYFEEVEPSDARRRFSQIQNARPSD